MLANYTLLLRRLEQLARRADLYQFLRQHGAPLPAGPDDWSLAVALLNALDSLIDTHAFDLDYLLDEAEEAGREFALEDIFLQEVVHLDGLDEDTDWDDWNELWQLAICLLYAGDGYGSNDRHAAVWWRDHAAALALPPLGQLDWDDIMHNLADLPAPWAGLDALLSWLLADTGNPFVDVPCEYAFEILDGYGLGWDAASLNWLVARHQDAQRQIFGPVRLLEDEWRRRPALTLRRCVDLALGRNCLVQDGEVIWLAEPEEVQPINNRQVMKGELIYA